MATDFSQLRSSTSLDKLTNELQKLQGNTQSDDRFWRPEVDKAGNGYAVIRFLPPPKGEDVPFVRYYNHSFKGPTGQWYIENSLTTLGKQDPVGEYNARLWNTGIESNKDIVRKQGRNTNYVSNIYVVEDPANPENVGKVFLYRYGKKIFEKLNDAMNPKFQDEKPINPFDFWQGANFKLKIRNVEGYRNYDKSEFASPGPLFDDDDKLKAIWEKESSLQEFLDPKNYKSYEELQKKFFEVIGQNQGAMRGRDTDEGFSTMPARASREAEAAPGPMQDASPFDYGVDTEASMDFFKEMAKD